MKVVRPSIGMAELPLNVPLEVEVTAVLGSPGQSWAVLE
jgi:hypothetical protein